jgi:hypothetical protein
VAIGSEKCFAGLAEALLVDGMADAVARLRVPHPEAPARAAQEEVIIGVLRVALNEQVVDVPDGELGSDLTQTHRFELKGDQRPSGVVGKDLVDVDRHLLTRRHLA